MRTCAEMSKLVSIHNVCIVRESHNFLIGRGDLKLRHCEEQVCIAIKGQLLRCVENIVC